MKKKSNIILLIILTIISIIFVLTGIFFLVSHVSVEKPSTVFTIDTTSVLFENNIATVEGYTIPDMDSKDISIGFILYYEDDELYQQKIYLDELLEYERYDFRFIYDVSDYLPSADRQLQGFNFRITVESGESKFTLDEVLK